VDGGDKWRKHRALKILRPTTELSGSYRCKVSSFVDEDFMQKTMIIYGGSPFCRTLVLGTVQDLHIILKSTSKIPTI
jgi:hypothetical protein